MIDRLASGRSLRRLFWLAVPLLFGLACGLGGSTATETAGAPTATTIAGTGPTATLAPGQTGASQSDTLVLSTPDTPTATAPEDTPPVTAVPLPTAGNGTTPTLGLVTGQITFQDRQSGEIQPDPDATVELVGDTTSTYFSTTTNPDGRYTLTNIPPGRYWLLVRSPTGSGNPQEVQVEAGQTVTVDLRMFTGYPTVSMRPAGGHVLVDGQPVEGAQVWRFGGLIESDKLAVTDASGYFSFPYLADTPVIAASGQRWTVTTLQPDAVIDIELDRTGPHPNAPSGPIVTPVPVNEDVVIIVSTPPPLELPERLIPEIEVIVPTPPLIVQPTRVRPELSTAVPQQPTPVPTVVKSTPTPTALPPIPTACGQSSEKIDYGPIKVGSIVILGQHETVNGTDSWDSAMEQYLKKKAAVTRLAGLDKVGCPVVQVDLDEGRGRWRIRALTLLEP